MVTLLLVALAAPPAGFAGRAIVVSGEVTLSRGDDRAPLGRGDYLLPGDVVATGESGKVRLLMRDKSVLALSASSRLKISAYDVEPASKKRKARLTVMIGRLWAFVTETVNPDASYEVDTHNAVAGVRGTELVFDVGHGGEPAVTVIEGSVDLAASAARETIGVRERGVVGDAGIALASTTEAAIAAMRADVRPDPELDTAKADRRLEEARKKSEGAETAPRGLADDQDAERDEPGTGDAVFEDVGASGNFDESGRLGPELPEFFDPSTMARVRVRVEVRP